MFTTTGMDDFGRPWLVCYDLADDRLRERVSGVLSAYGQRVQFSVFRCEVTDLERRRLVRELKRQLRAGFIDGDLRVFALMRPTPTVRREARTQGKSGFWLA